MAQLAVLCSTDIAAPIDRVAAFAADPINAPAWYEKIKSAEWVEGTQVRVGAKARFVARFLGQTLDYVYEIVSYDPGHCLVMAIAEGAQEMETTYIWRVRQGGTRMSIGNRGQGNAAMALFGPIMRWAMRRAMTNDLARLKQLMETGEADLHKEKAECG